MTTCPGLAPVPASASSALGGRVCLNCGRPVAAYGGRDQHRRGRIAGVSPTRSTQSARQRNLAAGRRVAARLAAVDLDGDICECGAPADPKLHPPVARHRIEAPGWPSRSNTPGVAWDGAPVEHPKMAEAQRARWNGRAATVPRLVLDPVAAALREADGNSGLAAIALGVSRQSLYNFIGYRRADLPTDVRDLLDARRRPGGRRRGVA